MDAGKYLQCAEIWGGNRFVETELTLPGLDAWIYCQPCASECGGDVHYLSSCASGQFARILLADVAGHGQAVGDTADHLRQLMQRYVIYHSQIELTRAINRHFARFSHNGEFATALVATFDAADNRFSLTNAGHPPPFHYQSATGQWSVLRQRPSRDGGEAYRHGGEAYRHAGEADRHGSEAYRSPELINVPLGVERNTLYGQLDLRLAVGDLVLWYTDALTEARTAAGEVLGVKGLLAELQKVDPANPARMIPDLLERITALQADNLTRDDATALVFRANGRRDFVSFTRLLMAPYRQARALLEGYAPGSAGST